MLKYIIFLVKSFLGNFYRHLVIFSGHTGIKPFCLEQTPLLICISCVVFKHYDELLKIFNPSESLKCTKHKITITSYTTEPWSYWNSIPLLVLHPCTLYLVTVGTTSATMTTIVRDRPEACQVIIGLNLKPVQFFRILCCSAN